MSFGNQTIFWSLITAGLNAVLWLAGKNNIAWSNILKNKMQNSYGHVISKEIYMSVPWFSHMQLGHYYLFGIF